VFKLPELGNYNSARKAAADFYDAALQELIKLANSSSEHHILPMFFSSVYLEIKMG